MLDSSAILWVLAGVVALVAWLVGRRLGADRRRARAVAALDRRWGRPVDRDRDSALLREALALAPTPDALDDGTWRDLDLDRIHAEADRSLTSPGEVALYRLLRAPLRDPQAIARRGELLQTLEDAPPARHALQLELQALGRVDDLRGLLHWVHRPVPQKPAYAFVHSLAALGALAALAAGFTLGGRAWALPVLAFFVNMTLHYDTRKGIEGHLATMRYLGRLITRARALSSLDLPAFAEETAALARHTEALRGVARATTALIPNRGATFDAMEMFYEYVSLFVLLETRAFFSILDALRDRQGDLRAVFELVGRLDALQAGASLRAGLERRCAPSFTAGELSLRVEDIVHPLLEDAVPNSLLVRGRSCLITGSNMSGKSTFLRTVGVNAVLAQTLAVCTASAYEASPFRIRTSIAPTDDLAHGKSFYYAEAERLLQMVQSAEGPAPTLCIIDELLRGTNSVERLAAGEEILAYLADQHALVIVATHDMELVERLREAYDGHHFSDSAEGGALLFDYRLRPGTPMTRNAIRLLEQMRFPQQIVDRAWRKAFGDAVPPPRSPPPAQEVEEEPAAPPAPAEELGSAAGGSPP